MKTFVLNGVAVVFPRGDRGMFKFSLSAEFNIPRRATTGSASASGYGSNKIEERGLADKENPVWRGSRNFERAFGEAVRNALREAEDKVRKIRPLSPDDARRDAWLALVRPIR